MNNYIGSIKDGYMFTNRLSGIATGDIIFNYDKMKYHKLAFTPQDKLDYIMENYDTDRQGYIDFYGTDKPHTIDDFKFSMGKVLMNGGKINAKYRVVGIGNTCKESPNNNEYQTRMLVDYDKYVIKCELIEEVDYELDEFISLNKLYKHMDEQGLNVIRRFTKQGALDTEIELKRYNGLTRVIKVIEE